MILQDLKHGAFADQLSKLVADATLQIICKREEEAR